MVNDCTKISCACGDSFDFNSFAAGFLIGKGMCEGCSSLSIESFHPLPEEALDPIELKGCQESISSLILELSILEELIRERGIPFYALEDLVKVIESLKEN